MDEMDEKITTGDTGNKKMTKEEWEKVSGELKGKLVEITTKHNHHVGRLMINKDVDDEPMALMAPGHIRRIGGESLETVDAYRKFLPSQIVKIKEVSEVSGVTKVSEVKEVEDG